MQKVFEVTDELEISREAIQVELLPAGSGAVERLDSGRLRIVLPEDGSQDEWIESLGRRIETLAPDLVGAE